MSIRSLAAAKFYEEEHARLRSFVRRIVGNHATAEDLVPQAFTNFLNDVHRPVPENAAYITRAVRNLALNYLRDTRRRSQTVIAGVETETIADPAPSPEMIALYRDELIKLLEAIAALPARRREAFILNKIEGLSYDEIASRMGTSRNTVISQVVAALVDLDRLLPRD